MKAGLGGRPRQVASLDSTTTLLLALAHALHGRDFRALGHPRALEPLVRATALLPARWRSRLYTAAGWLGGVPERRMGRARAEAISAWAAGLYPARRYPMLFIGSTNGAAMHLCAALGVPWLPQTFLLGLRQCIADPDDLARRMRHATAPARALLAANPLLALHHMADPVHDRPQQPVTGYLRVKLLGLTEAYRAFIERALAPGGRIVVVDCRLRWPVTRVGERHVFQVGGVGGTTLDEYRHGGPRVERFLAAHGARRRRWEPPPADEEAPEAEWGFAPQLDDDLLAFARRRGYRLSRLVLPTPHDLSAVVAALYRHWYRDCGLPADRLLVEMFFLVEPYWMLRSGAVPYWLLFNTEPDLDRLREWLDHTDPFARIDMTLLSTAIDPIGMVSPARWRDEVLARAPAGGFPGMDVRRYPYDLGSLARYHHALKRAARRRQVSPQSMAPEFAEAFIRAHGPRHGVRWQDED